MIVDFQLWFLSFSLVASLEKFFFLYSSHLYYVYKRISCKKTRKSHMESGQRRTVGLSSLVD